MKDYRLILLQEWLRTSMIERNIKQPDMPEMITWFYEDFKDMFERVGEIIDKDKTSL